MNRYILTAWAFVVATCTPVMAWAADPVTTTGREFGENLMNRPVWIAILMVATWVLTRMWKDPTLPGRLDPRWRALGATGIAILGGVTEALIREATFPSAMEGVQNGIIAAGGAVYVIQDVIIKGFLNSRTEPPPAPPATGGTTTTTTTVATTTILCLLLATITGCSGSPIVDGATAHKHAVQTVDAAAPVLREHCVEPMQKAAAIEDVAKRREGAIEIARRCDVPVAAYETARAAVIVLGAALVAAVAGDLSRLPAALASAGDATVKLAMAIAQVTK